MTRIVVTGGDGFIGRNLRLRLQELGHTAITSLEWDTPAEVRAAALAEAEFVFHLAGVNRPPDPSEFDTGNRGVTVEICDALRAAGGRCALVFSSSVQAALENPYGRSKRAAEEEIARYGADTGAPALVLRLANVFGKWSRPNYNSAVATFCHNIARGLPITINDLSSPLQLVYVDDVVTTMIGLLEAPASASGEVTAGPVYRTTVGELAEQIRRFAGSRATRITDRVGEGFTRALYSTYLSFLPPADFAYSLVTHTDPRGSFAEILKTPDCGQFSFFTAHPGVTRGGHYHHTKTEKFLVVQGRARFGFRHVLTGETFTLETRGDDARVVETVPGWAHDITNIGDDPMIVLLWANEQFDPQRPDTISAQVHP